LHGGTFDAEMISAVQRLAPSSMTEDPDMSTWRRIGLFLCWLGWHRRPYSRFAARHHCRRCGLVGWLDLHGNLDPDAVGGPPRPLDLGLEARARRR
jgi:hypothetical protein